MKYWYLMLVCVLLVSLFIFFEKKEKYVLAVIFKGLSSLCFISIGLLNVKNVVNIEYAKLVSIGLILGGIADILLNLRFVFKKIGKIIFLIGILVFLSGHVLYLCALIPSCPNVLMGILIGLALTIIIMIYIFRRIKAGMAFKVFGVFYIGSVVLMATFAMLNLCYCYSLANLLYAIGGVSFLISDIVLILNTFTGKTRFSLRITNLSLYYIGQLLIAISLGV